MSWTLLIVFLSFSQLLFAETDLDPIEVEATKDIERFTFSNSVVIEANQLNNEPLGLISTALEKVHGLVASQNGGPGGRISFFLRGTESRHLSFTLDGLKINDTSNTDRQFDAAFMPSPALRDMTVYKGPQAVLFGSDAMGGLIEMRTRKGENAPETRLTVNGGSFGTLSSSLSKDWQSEKNNGSLTLLRFHSDGISRLNQKRYDAKEKDATDITQMTSSSEHRWGDKTQTDLLSGYINGKAEQDGYGEDTSQDYTRNDQYFLQQKTNYTLNEAQAISLRNGFNRHQRLNSSHQSTEEFFNGNLFEHELIHRLEHGPFGVISGISNEHEHAKAINLDDSFDLNSIFSLASFLMDDFKMHLGARSDRHSKYGVFNTGSAGLAFQEFLLQYSEGFKAPSLYQLYGPDSFGSPVGNPDLIPETNHSMEISWKRSKEAYDAGISLFQNRLSNLFTYSFEKGYINQQKFIAEGIELSGKRRMNSFEFSGSFTHQQFKEEKVTILRRPYNIAFGGISYFPNESMELNVNSRWYSSRKDFEAKLNGFEVLDLGIKKTWEEDEMTLQLRNVLNREYEEIYGFSVLPRSVFAGYGHQFQ